MAYQRAPNLFVSANHSSTGGNLDPMHNSITAWVEVRQGDLSMPLGLTEYFCWALIYTKTFLLRDLLRGLKNDYCNRTQKAPNMHDCTIKNS